MFDSQEASSFVRQDPSVTATGKTRNQYAYQSPAGHCIYRVDVINQTDVPITVIDDHGVAHTVPPAFQKHPDYEGLVVIRKSFSSLRKTEVDSMIFSDMYLKHRETEVRKALREYYNDYLVSAKKYPVTICHGANIEIVINPHPDTGYDNPQYCPKSGVTVVRQSANSHRHFNPRQSTVRTRTKVLERTKGLIKRYRYRMIGNVIAQDTCGLLLQIVDNNGKFKGKYVNLFGKPFYCKTVKNDHLSSGAYFTKTNKTGKMDSVDDLFPDFIPLDQMTPENGFFDEEHQAVAFGDSKLRTAMLEEAKQQRTLEEAERVRQHEQKKREREALEAQAKREHEAREAQAKRDRELQDREYEQLKRQQDEQAAQLAREHEIRMQQAKEEAAKRDSEFRESMRQATVNDRLYDRKVQSDKYAKEEKVSKRKNFIDAIKYFAESIAAVTGLAKIIRMFTGLFAPA